MATYSAYFGLLSLAGLGLFCSMGCGPLGSEGANPVGSPSPSSSAGAGGNQNSNPGVAGSDSSNPSVAGSDGSRPVGVAGSESSLPEPNGGQGGAMPSSPADWSGVIGTGQSLAVGNLPVNPAVNQQPYGNLMLGLGGALVPPFDPASAALAMLPLAEPLRGQGSGFPRAYPGNLWGETPHGAMASQISALVRETQGGDYVTVHSVVGESGQGMVAIRKGATETMLNGGIVGRAYAASLFEVAAITRLAVAASKSYRVGAIVLTHGETDAGSSNYEAELVQLWSDYNQDVAQITGQTHSIPMIVSQHHAYGFTAGATSFASTSTLAQWRVGRNHPGDIICSGPKYQYPYVADGIHLEVRGYEMLGEKYGEIYHEVVVLGNAWRPLEPTTVTKSGRILTLAFNVPVPPLVWDEEIPAPHQTALTAWAAGRGFEVRSGNTPIAIESVAIAGTSIEITCAADIPTGAVVGYAVTSDGTAIPGLGHRWGQLRDSDPFVGAITGAAQANYAVAFELPVP